jgi:hypothetical protein
MNPENQQRFVKQLLIDISPNDIPFKDCVNAVKDAMENIKSIQTDLNASLEDVASKIHELKEDIKSDLQDYIDESLESEPEKENPYDALDNSSTDTTCSILITLISILLIIIGVVSVQKNLKML